MAWQLVVYLAGIPIMAVAIYVAFERTVQSSKDIVDEFLAGIGALFSALIWPVLVVGYAVAIIGKSVNQHLRSKHAPRN